MTIKSVTQRKSVSSDALTASVDSISSTPPNPDEPEIGDYVSFMRGGVTYAGYVYSYLANCMICVDVGFERSLCVNKKDCTLIAKQYPLF